MKTSNLRGAMLLAVMAPLAPNAGTRVALCLETPALVSHAVVERAKALASHMYSVVGLQLEWLVRGDCEKADAIHVRIDDEAPAGLSPGVMAHALPYGKSGTRIHIFYNRIVANLPTMTVELLGQIMAHEIAHVLQGVARHSETGLMKAYWGPADYFAMRGRPLPFADEDVQLMYLGIEKRAGRVLTATR